MDKYLSLRLTGCVKGEKIKITFSVLNRMYVALLTEEEFDKYKDNVNSVKRSLCSTNAIATIQRDGVWYVVVDNNDIDLQNIKCDVYRYAPSFTNDDIWNNVVPQGMSCVLNATDTESDGSMIQYWKDHQHKNSKINLENKTFVCPSCGKTVNVRSLHGAHVIKQYDIKGALYITPTCDSCNTSKTNRVFKVNDVDLIIAPN